MLRALTSVLWLIAALALGFESVAQPCEIASKMDVSAPHEMHAEMPCHDDMAPAHDTSDEMPEHQSHACCCAALLGNGVETAAPELNQPLPELLIWATPMSDSAMSILLEYEPPPPRA
ncbi:MAG: hypothetical protein AAFQ24_06205 [Pseudomonadota bacterium]